MLVPECLLACACLWWVTRAAQQAMEVAQVECGCFFGWLGFFFALYVQTVDSSQYDLNSIIFIRLRAWIFSKDLKVQSCIVTYYSKQ